MEAFLLDSLGLLLRWLHVVAAIAWIGESFYFVALDRGLRKPAQPGEGLFGESWSVHGGGFYRKQKYMPAPPQLPELLHWSKWKSYTTWLSGFALFALIYLASPQVYLVDPAVAALDPRLAIVLALLILPAGWLIYDALCRLVAFRDGVLGLLVALLALGLAWLCTSLFAGRAAFLLVGAVLATIMSANVFFVIIPGQKRMVEALRRGDAVDPLPGLRGKQRSVHNTYLTLPVVFTMLSIHFPAAHAHPHSWLLLGLFMLAGALIRQFFVLWHSGERAWWLPAAGCALLLLAFAWMAPRAVPDAGSLAPPVPTLSEPDGEQAVADSSDPEGLADHSTAAILPLVHRHCGACHAAKPSLLAVAPLGIVLDTEEQLERHALRVHQQTVTLRVMPPGNMTGMQEEERQALARWYRQRP